MTLNPSTLLTLVSADPNRCTITVYKSSVRFQKPGALLLNLPANKVSFDFDDERKNCYVSIDEDGFRVCEKVQNGFCIYNRSLAKVLLEIYKATERVRLFIQATPVATGRYKLVVKDKV